MNFPRIFDIFSRRHRESERVNKPLTTEFRNRVIMLCVDKFSDPVMPTPVIRRSQFWSEMHTNLRYLHGRPDLAGRNRESADKEVITFLASCSDEHFLDFVEYASKSQALKISTINSAEFIRSVNEFFDLDALPYYLTGFRISAGESVHPSTIGFPTSDPPRRYPCLDGECLSASNLQRGRNLAPTSGQSNSLPLGRTTFYFCK